MSDKELIANAGYDYWREQRNKLNALHDALQRSGTGIEKLGRIRSSTTVQQALASLEDRPGTLTKAIRWLRENCREELGKRHRSGKLVGEYYRNA